MATAILLILTIPAEGFLLYCLFHFSLEMHGQSRSGPTWNCGTNRQKQESCPFNS